MSVPTRSVPTKARAPRRTARLLKVLVVGGAMLAASCATTKGGEGAKPAGAKPADSGSGGGVSGW